MNIFSRRFREPAANKLPSAWWLVADGREVIVDRAYRPLRERRPGGPAYKPEPGEWYDLVAQRWLYFSSGPINGRVQPTALNSAKVRELARDVLKAFEAGAPVAHMFTWTQASMRALSMTGRRS